MKLLGHDLSPQSIVIVEHVFLLKVFRVQCNFVHLTFSRIILNWYKA